MTLFGIDVTGFEKPWIDSYRDHRALFGGGPLGRPRIFGASISDTLSLTQAVRDVNRDDETVCVSFKRWDAAAFRGWMDSLTRETWVAYYHEVEDDGKRGVTAAQPATYLQVYAAMDAARKAHPKGNLVRLVKVFMWYQQIIAPRPGYTWREYHGGQTFVDALGWDCYSPKAWAVNQGRYATAQELLGPVKAMADETGLPWCLPELGGVLASGDADGALRDAAIAQWTDYAKANGALWVNWWCGTGAAGSHHLDAVPRSLQRWRSLMARPLYAGHRPGQVTLGIAAADRSVNLTFDQAVKLIGSPVQARRMFSPGWITAARVDAMRDTARAGGYLPVISFKVPNRDWPGVTAGKYDRDLTVLANALASRPDPIVYVIEHEPAGTTGVTVDQWAAMQTHIATFPALLALRDVATFGVIGNGFWFGAPQLRTTATPLQLAAWLPDSLLAALTEAHGLLMTDCYDASASPTSLKVANFIKWARSKGLRAVGCGEWGCFTGAEITKTWNVMFTNRDIFTLANYFDSGQNSSADWRLIPEGYPPDPAVTWSDPGGTPAAAGRLLAFRAALAQSQVPG